MRIPTWRLGLVAGAIVVLAGSGIGFAAAAVAPSKPAAVDVAAAGTPEPGGPLQTAGPDHRGPAMRAGMAARLLRITRHLVHIEATVTDRDDNLVDLWLDHGTVQAIGAGTLTILESDGATRAIGLDGATIVRTGRDAGSLADIKVGDEVFVLSKVDAGSPLAKRVRIVSAGAAATG